MKLSPHKIARARIPAELASKAPRGEVWAAKTGPWALTPPALIAFGGYMPSPRAGRRAADGGDRR
ncbi:MAG TPA: hypothetical protein VFH62_00625 [Dehalococcoidia bacterium]|nr:hypothetical protein [Dehalococcoidia bacterium]